jgi:hypothetical protein
MNSTISLRHGAARDNGAMRDLLHRLGRQARERRARTSRVDERRADGYACLVERYEARRQSAVACD